MLVLLRERAASSHGGEIAVRQSMATEAVALPSLRFTGVGIDW